MGIYRISDLNIEIITNAATLQNGLKGREVDYECEPNLSLTLSDDRLLELMEENEGKTADMVETAYMATLYSWGIFDFNGFPIKATAVEHDGKAVLFAAPFDESVDFVSILPQEKCFVYDYPGVRLEDTTYYVFDTPFGYHASLSKLHKKLPLSAIVFVDGQKFDSLKKLEAKDFVPMFMRGVALNIRHERTKHTLFILEKLMHSVSFYGVGSVDGLDFILDRVTE